MRFEWISGPESRIVVVNTPNGFTAARKTYEPVVLEAGVEGQIQQSLWEAAVERCGLDAEVVLKFSDIFAYDIDFFTDVQPGDTFCLLYEKLYCQDRYLGSGRLLFAEFTNNGRKLEAYYYQNGDGEDGYYDAAGRSLRKMFLKSPLRYRRISSYFTRSRYHPILKIYRPHLGIDYAAPVGTPIETIGDGVVTFVGWNKGYGRFVKIKHNRTYTTTYGHLSGYAKGLHKGQRVRQGELIGYVGSSGLSTGPHLDFRMVKDGRFINPLSLKLEPAPPIKASEKERFFEIVEQVRAGLGRQVAARK